MALKEYKSTSPGRRGMSVSDFREITKEKPEKGLSRGKKSTGGRNSQGKITTRYRGGGVKRKLREIDFKRDKDGIIATVISIEYDPNRTANIALLAYADGEKRYILAPVKLSTGDKLMSGENAEIQVGNCLKIKDIPSGTAIHNIEMQPEKGAKLVRSAGQIAQIRSKEGKFARVRLPSGEIRLINMHCKATIGQVGNLEHIKRNLGKAGVKRYLGKRPHVRGVAMNPVDHPMGGGEGRSSGGGHPQSPKGKLAKSGKTRKPKKASNKHIIQRRKK